MSSVQIQFSPSATATPPFQFAATLDGMVYTVSVTWNVYRQGWYITVTDDGGNTVICHPLVSGGVNAPINLCPGIFTASALTYDDGLQVFTATDNSASS